MLLNIAVQAARENENNDTPTVIRACIADYDTSRSMRVVFVLNSTKASLCVTSNKALEEGLIYMH
ncbi:uncharacterized protein ColSpa_01192 [Colletotrichum spaethianum]|uniref:Uncharacterized protein n=1 Tax=Colletotrichum spaethianum TaxID=700344 RepID=A0AA37L3F1_9PEZI|nr:uncharacterized protein ColSpa_01192 [Colletotrichum spaethianum]GKT41011.1 hypothetical protein ColSpa_01192 [Colletotrichum spaethianum]